MNTLISSAEAIKKSKINLKKKMSEEQKRELEFELKKKKEIELENREYKKEITAIVIGDINQAVKNGESSVNVILQENWNFKFETKCFKFDSIIKELVEKLKSKKHGYDVYYGPNKVYHDTTNAYMNSGGECGSSEPYYTDVLSLYIKWDKK